MNPALAHKQQQSPHDTALVSVQATAEGFAAELAAAREQGPDSAHAHPAAPPSTSAASIASTASYAATLNRSLSSSRSTAIAGTHSMRGTRGHPPTATPTSARSSVTSRSGARTSRTLGSIGGGAHNFGALLRPVMEEEDGSQASWDSGGGGATWDSRGAPALDLSGHALSREQPSSVMSMQTSLALQAGSPERALPQHAPSHVFSAAPSLQSLSLGAAPPITPSQAPLHSTHSIHSTHSVRDAPSEALLGTHGHALGGMSTSGSVTPGSVSGRWTFRSSGTASSSGVGPFSRSGASTARSTSARASRSHGSAGSKALLRHTSTARASIASESPRYAGSLSGVSMGQHSLSDVSMGHSLNGVSMGQHSQLDGRRSGSVLGARSLAHGSGYGTTSGSGVWGEAASEAGDREGDALPLETPNEIRRAGWAVGLQAQWGSVAASQLTDDHSTVPSHWGARTLAVGVSMRSRMPSRVCCLGFGSGLLGS